MITLRELNQLAESLGLGPDTQIGVTEFTGQYSHYGPQEVTEIGFPTESVYWKPTGAPVLCLSHYCTVGEVGGIVWRAPRKPPRSISPNVVRFPRRAPK